MPCPTPVQLQSSTKGKRDNSDLSSAQEDGLQTSLKHELLEVKNQLKHTRDKLEVKEE